MKYISLYCVIFLGVFTSCEKSLTDQEKAIIDDTIPEILLKEEVESVGEELVEYLVDALDQYSNELCDQLQNKIDERNATAALFGGNFFDVAELFGTSTNEIISKQYNRYVKYINNHLSDMAELTYGMTGILINHPEFIKNFYKDTEPSISLEIFQGLNVPESIPRSSLDSLGSELTLAQSNKITWGKELMGNYKQPQMSVPTILYASILAVKDLKRPTAVYAVYDDETESWSIGYNSKQALSIKFTENEDIIHYEYKKIDFYDQLITSKLNFLSKNNNN